MNEVLRDELIELINTRSYYENERSMFKMVTDITNAVYLSLPTAGPMIVSNIKPMEEPEDFEDIEDLRIKPDELILHFEVINDREDSLHTKQPIHYYVVLESNKEILMRHLKENYSNPTISSTPILTVEEFHETFLEFIMDQPTLTADLYNKFLKYEEYLVLTGATDCVEDPFATPFDDSPVYHLPEQLKEKEIVPVVEEPYPPAPVYEVPQPAAKMPISEVFSKLVETFDLKADDKFNGLDKNGLVIDAIPFEEPEAIEAEVIEEAPTRPQFQLTDHQQLKFDGLIQKINDILILSNSITRPPNNAYYLTCLEGAAGTGKTTMMVKVLETLMAQGNSIVFCSPTHQALGVIRETLKTNWIDFTEVNEEYMMGDATLIIKTLASFLGIKMQRDLENGTESFVPDPRAPQICADILAVDESSMISKDQLRILLQKLHIHVKCILFIGDEVQLDSPADNNESNGVFGIPQKYALEEVVRQAAGNTILQLAWELRGYILSGKCDLPPSLLLSPQRTNDNIIILKNQVEFINHYFANENENILFATYTNKITNEYNDYVRQMKISGQGGKPLEIDIDGTGRNIINSWDEYKEYFVGEDLVVLEPNQRNDTVIHQTGEKIKIHKLSEQTHSLFISIQPDGLMGEPETHEFKIRFWEIYDTNLKRINVVHKDDVELYNEILRLLSVEAKKSKQKHAWSKYWSFKEKFTRVNRVYAFTLHKLQGSTCTDIYVDIRDLDKFWQRMRVGVYKLIYIALTRPKNRVIFLT